MMPGVHRSVDESHTIGRWLRERAAAMPTRIAIDDRGVVIDYATLHARAQRMANVLRDAGYGAGHRIATVSGNSADHVVAFFACAYLGIAFVPLSWRLTPAELSDLMSRSDPALVLVEEEYSALAMEALRMLGDEAPNHAKLGELGAETSVSRAGEQVSSRSVKDDDPLLIIFTSGSEAAPKGVVLTHANCFWNNLALSQAMPMTPDDVVLSMLPQYHVAGWNIQPLLAWWTGATVVLERSFNPGRVLQLIQERGVTTMMGVPTQYRMLRDQPEWHTTDLSSLRVALVGGATIPAGLAADLEPKGIRLTQGYGLTEAGPNVLSLPAGDQAAHPGSVGLPYSGVEVCLVDPDTQLELSGVATGELWVRGPSVFAGYLNDPEATKRAMVGDWLRTGDLVSRDEHGKYRVVDRLKDMFVSGGENVAPAEVEAALVSHPLVSGVAVVAVPDPVWGERGVAFVTTIAPVSQDELLSHARTRLAAFKVPIRIFFLRELPRTTIEKIARRQLRERARFLMHEPRKDGTHVNLSRN
jgi:fatty-acyl-CoA synthase